jgi:TrmH family RNA methyltransferase
MLSKRIVKYIQSLSQKKLRDDHGQFIAETPKVVAEFLSAENFECKILCADKTWLSENENLLKNILPGNIYEIDETILKKISLLKTPNKVLTVFGKKLPASELVIPGKLSLMLDSIQDPGNLGTIIRNADWFGLENIICSENCADCYNPKVVQASMGSLARVNVLYVSLRAFIEANDNVSVYAATLYGTSISALKNIEEGIILIGNESRGISEELLNMATLHITIPRYGNAESLNAAVATGIILSHIKSGP